jgi:hypothetical protein
MSIDPTLGCNNILLVFQWFPDSNKAVLEDSSCIPKDEINSAGNDTASVELAVSLCIQGILVSFKTTVEEYCTISLDSDGHGLMFLWTCCVSESHSFAQKSFS